MCAIRSKADLLGELICQFMHSSRLGEQECVEMRVLFVVCAHPRHAERTLGLQLDDAHIQDLVIEQTRWSLQIARLDDFVDSLVGRALEHRLGSTIRTIRHGEAQHKWVLL